jgi:hypothetical protein
MSQMKETFLLQKVLFEIERRVHLMVVTLLDQVKVGSLISGRKLKFL